MDSDENTAAVRQGLVHLAQLLEGANSKENVLQLFHCQREGSLLIILVVGYSYLVSYRTLAQPRRILRSESF